MKPILSIGIIFKNEIRCLERCVKSLQPLRDAVPCELVMADTGSDDGSREIAEKYADIFFDFPWIDDFAAARNSVMDRCSGEWYFSIDADEWLDEDISELAAFLRDRDQWVYGCCGIMLRNYKLADTFNEYTEFLATRMARMSTGMRYEGAIHETWPYAGTLRGLGRTLLHHDGYVGFSKEHLEEKFARNMKLLRERLARDPEDLRTLQQCLESSAGTPSYEGYLRRALAVLAKDPEGLRRYGASILRYAVFWAAGMKLPELDEWLAWMEKEFPDSPFTNIDVGYALFLLAAEKKEYDQTILKGERYLCKLADYRAGLIDYTALIQGALVMSTQSIENKARILLSDAYFHEKHFQKARDMLLSVDCDRIENEVLKIYMAVLLNLHAQSGEDLSPVMVDLWEKFSRSKEKRELQLAVIQTSATAFSPEHRNAEDENGSRHAYTLFLPLAGKCGLGTAAAILETGDRVEMERLLRTVDNWEELPVAALERALLAGVVFPLPDQPLTLEEMDSLAARLAQNGSCLPEFLDKAVRTLDEEPQSLAWARGLALAALHSTDWEADGDGMAVIRAFAAVERVFLSRYYAPAMLCGENICLLPPMHRFGWYCVQALDVLDTGDKTGYVRLLREGLASCPDAKRIVEFLIENTPELQAAQIPQANAELLALADQVRTMLAAYDPNDPMVMALKQSAAYQKVAWIIENTEGLPQ